MKLYRIAEGPARLGPGEVAALLPAQYALRKDYLRSLGEIADRVHVEVTQPVEFKKGEVIGLEFDPPKAHLHRYESLEPAEP